MGEDKDLQKEAEEEDNPLEVVEERHTQEGRPSQVDYQKGMRHIKAHPVVLGR